jgi:predicted ATP-dependent endonuclease of OLD family
MRIEFVELSNFRKLKSVRIGFSKDKTVFVGANNSGKSSAMVALRYFLIERERANFSLTDFTLSNWPTLDELGRKWEKEDSADAALDVETWNNLLPSLDVWLHVEDNEIHYVQKILPTLDWEGGLLGVRLKLEPKDGDDLRNKFVSARSDATRMQQAAQAIDAENQAPDRGSKYSSIPFWPRSLTDFLSKRLGQALTVKAYVLDPTAVVDPEHGVARPQPLVRGRESIDGDPFKGLIKIDEISAQRGFGHPDAMLAEDESSGARASPDTRRLSDQLRQYYNKHLNPDDSPEIEDLQALKAIEDAQKAFDLRLKDAFDAALSEMAKLGYPGVTDPRLTISTRIKPVDGLDHKTAVQYVVQTGDGQTAVDLNLPEASNGLGYQNLISMVFRLMSFRDAWMRVGKAKSRAARDPDFYIPPLHLVLVEEPEAYLHTQVQQLFIRQAYNILRSNKDLGSQGSLTTQLIVSTHSSHIVHECDFESLRYFRRLPSVGGGIPTSCVVNVSNVFGTDMETRRFVTRYLKVAHCDLFFADAAILLEGPAERLLIPYFIRNLPQFKPLSECYLTWLEIGGSHAHRLRGLIEHLGLTTLVITDLDAKDKEGNVVPPKRDASQSSRNETLKTWCPKKASLDELADLPAESLILNYDSQHFAIRVAYQQPVVIKFRDADVEAFANTLEDALVYQNIDFFGSHQGKGLLSKFKTAISASQSIDELSGMLTKHLARGGKAELALDILEIQNESAIKPPSYIEAGLRWLADELQRRQRALGLPVPGATTLAANKGAQ